MKHESTGTFDVTLDALPLHDALAAEKGFGRRALRKRFHGGLVGTSVGEMLSSLSAVEGSGTYVALERFTGTLDGREGTFCLHHLGVRRRGVPTLQITVVPDSGTGSLEGLTGEFHLRIEAGVHAYTFAYELPERS